VRSEVNSRVFLMSLTEIYVRQLPIDLPEALTKMRAIYIQVVRESLIGHIRSKNIATREISLYFDLEQINQ